MDSKENDNHSHKKLDSEFRRILRIIKPYIPCIMNNDYLTSYRLWLEKLSEVGSNEKKERNRYLIELCYQIQDGILEYPFTELPTVGSLPPFPNDNHSKQQQGIQHKVWKDTENTDQRSSKSAQTNCLNSPSSSRKDTHNSECATLNELSKTQQSTIKQVEKSQSTAKKEQQSEDSAHPGKIISPKKRTAHTITRTPPKQIIHEMLLDSPQNIPASPNMLLTPYYVQEVAVPVANYLPIQPSFIPARLNITKTHFHKYIKTNDKLINDDGDEEGSWCDISEVSTSTRTKSPFADSLKFPSPRFQEDDENVTVTAEMYENRITELMSIITNLQKQNITLNEEVAKYERDLTIRNTKAETSIHNLQGEVDSLKFRLQELKDIKAALKKSQLVAASQWESTVNSLTKDLQITQNQNEILKSEITNLEKKLEEFSIQRQKENSNLREKLSDIHMKEIEMLKQNQIKHISDLESTFYQKLNDIKNEYENKVTEFKIEYEKIIHSKNTEIQRLENLIETQCKRMHEEVNLIRNQMEEATTEQDENLEKIAFLQKCIAKMDKLFKKSETTFCKQITKLKNEIEVRDKIIHIQLSSQRAELIANTNTEKQMEVDATVVHLENRYRKLLEKQQSKFLNEKKHDASMISQLRATIAKNNVDTNV